MSISVEAVAENSHADCDIKRSLGLLGTAVNESNKPLHPLLRILIYADCSSAKQIHTREQMLTYISAEIIQITSINCTDNCDKCVWREILDDSEHDNIANIIEQMLEVPEEDLTKEVTMSIVEKEYNGR
jgi:hypothetical protein